MESYSILNTLQGTHPFHGPGVTLLTQVVLHLGLQPHAVAVLPHLREAQRPTVRTEELDV